MCQLSLHQPKSGKTRTPEPEDATELPVCSLPAEELNFAFKLSRYVFVCICGGSYLPSLGLRRVCVCWPCGCSLFAVHDRRQLQNSKCGGAPERAGEQL